MSIELKLSNYPAIADILFKDGTKRSVHHTVCTTHGRFVVFIIGEKGGDEVYVNVETIATIDMTKAAETVGGPQ